MNVSFNNKITEIQNDTSVIEKMYKVEKTISIYEEQIQNFKIDQSSFKNAVEEDIESFKSMSHNFVDETNAQLRVFEKNLTKLSMPELEKLEEKTQFLEYELVNMKNMQMKLMTAYKTQVQELSSKIQLKEKGSVGKIYDSNQLKSLSEEVDEISLFVQKFADSHVTDQIRIIRDTE